MIPMRRRNNHLPALGQDVTFFCLSPCKIKITLHLGHWSSNLLNWRVLHQDVHQLCYLWAAPLHFHIFLQMHHQLLLVSDDPEIWGNPHPTTTCFTPLSHPAQGKLIIRESLSVEPLSKVLNFLIAHIFRQDGSDGCCATVIELSLRAEPTRDALAFPHTGKTALPALRQMSIVLILDARAVLFEIVKLLLRTSLLLHESKHLLSSDSLGSCRGEVGDLFPFPPPSRFSQHPALGQKISLLPTKLKEAFPHHNSLLISASPLIYNVSKCSLSAGESSAGLGM